MTLLGFVEHQTADSLRHVAWKISARETGDRPLLVKQFSGGAQHELNLKLEMIDPELPLETQFQS